MTKTTEAIGILETEISQAEAVLLEMELELHKAVPSYEELKRLSAEIIRRGDRIQKAIERDKP